MFKSFVLALALAAIASSTALAADSPFDKGEVFSLVPMQEDSTSCGPYLKRLDDENVFFDLDSSKQGGELMMMIGQISIIPDPSVAVPTATATEDKSAPARFEFRMNPDDAGKAQLCFGRQASNDSGRPSRAA